ncbi:MAG: cytochrome-c peroxidase [Bacteroidetes bacterium]|nr:cytochrome-c peroxidase [Bacteroidota bacterium]MCA6443154.1 cytochrome-c peroxidase [Bacteroidota bacterium]
MTGCKVDPKIKSILPANDLQQIIPENWPKPIYTFSTNTISQERFKLGRELFYDVILSEDNTVACGSCHQQFAAFAHFDHDVSHGINERLGTRNAPGLFNLTWHPNFMHDGGINHIENQPLAPITNTLEMGGSLLPILEKLKASSKYQKMFGDAFENKLIDTKKLSLAITQFMGLMTSYNSKYDYWKRNENNVQLSDAELRGYSLFISKCSSCHSEPLFSDFAQRNNGLPPNSVNDIGRELITGESSDRYKFKTPSLRNIALTAPYMHDGRFKSLQECLNHYTGPITNTLNLSPLIPVNGIILSVQDKSDLIAFLYTLTDYKFINDKRFSDPNTN